MNNDSGSHYSALIVEDDREMRESLCHLLERSGWSIESTNDGADAAERARKGHHDVVLSDVRMPGTSGLELLESLGETAHPPVVLISAHGDIPMAVEAMSKGAYSFLEKPFEPRRLLTVLKHAAEKHRLQKDSDRLKARLAQLSDLDRVLIGESRKIAQLRDDILALSDSNAPIMIEGETGTGKELVAHALHDLSVRASDPFIAVNCAAIAPDHFEQAMFGNADGEPGLFMRADKGTLFLDEIAACPTDMQPKLLRVLETSEFMPLGATAALKTDIRVISATNESLDQKVADGSFRSDLLYRLNTVVLPLPALREHKDDIPLLYAHFCEQFGELYEVQTPDTTAEDLAALMSHDWPGNVRELRSVSERRILAARRGRGSAAEAIRLDDDLGDVPDTLRESVAAFERQLIAAAVKSHKGRMDAAAEALGIGRRTLNEKIVKLGLNREELL